MVARIIRFFDKLEDKIRIRLSHRPILYALIGGVGIVLFWKGVWELAELFPILHGFGSIALGVVILLLTGLLVSFFIGDTIILSGIKQEKKLVEKSEKEIAAEVQKLDTVIQELAEIREDLGELKEDKRNNAPPQY